MPALTSPRSVKIIGANGQISLGKQFAGRQVLVEEKEAGVWLIRTATVIPDNERWLHEPQAASDLSKALAWSAQNPASDTQTDALFCHQHPPASDGDGRKRQLHSPGFEQPGVSRKPVRFTKTATQRSHRHPEKNPANELEPALPRQRPEMGKDRQRQTTARH